MDLAYQKRLEGHDINMVVDIGVISAATRLVHQLFSCWIRYAFGWYLIR